MNNALRRVYLDNAATTPIDPAVVEAMLPYLSGTFGNPSSIHWHGRQARAAIERARKSVAQLLNCAPGEIFFTSGGTEADNMLLAGAFKTHGINRIITSPIEHHAVLHAVEHLATHHQVDLVFVKLDEQGFVDYEHLAQLLSDTSKPTLVTLMHGNNEVGNLLGLDHVSALCKAAGAWFHSDTVQTIGHYAIDLQVSPVDYIVGAAHKFHGVKGTGFAYIHSNSKLPPMIHGGSQERNMRGGTENVAGIVGLATALEIAYKDVAAHHAHVLNLKQQMMQGLGSLGLDIRYNGGCATLDRSLYTVLNVSFPPGDWGDMMLQQLDIEGISASGGSACTSGSMVGSHVLNALGTDPDRSNVRFSFSKMTTAEDIAHTLHVLQGILKPESVNA